MEVDLKIPDGWVLVPREPTKEMIKRYCARATELGFHAWINASTAWAAMIEAAPPSAGVETNKGDAPSRDQDQGSGTEAAGEREGSL